MNTTADRIFLAALGFVTFAVGLAIVLFTQAAVDAALNAGVATVQAQSIILYAAGAVTMLIGILFVVSAGDRK